MKVVILSTVLQDFSGNDSNFYGIVRVCAEEDADMVGVRQSHDLGLGL